MCVCSVFRAVKIRHRERERTIPLRFFGFLSDERERERVSSQEEVSGLICDAVYEEKATCSLSSMCSEEIMYVSLSIV